MARHEHMSSKSKMVNGRHFEEMDKSQCVHNGLTDLDKIWHNGVYWTLGRRYDVITDG